jgi:hypothetical protein
MTVFKSELSEYGMTLTTKCLNTAVMTMYTFLGVKALKYTRYCDVDNVERRYQKIGDKSVAQIKTFANKLLKANPSNRVLYYVMFTDGTLPHIDNNTSVSFPGHVFVIDKFYDDVKKQPRYNIYQSYINEYDLNGAIERNQNTMEESFENMKRFTQSMVYFFENGVWDKNISEFWKEFTFTDPTEFENHLITGKILFCYRAVNVDVCSKMLKDLLTQKVIDVNFGIQNEVKQLISLL